MSAARVSRWRRRSVLLAPLALSGCGLWDHWFGEHKTPLPGTRIPVMRMPNALHVTAAPPRVIRPPPVANAAWPQAGGNPAHAMGHLRLADAVQLAWRADIGAGGGYRRKITAQPVAADGRVFSMDSDAVVRAFDLASGRRLWECDTRAAGDRSTNIGGGIACDGGRLYAATGRGDLLAIDAAKGTILWRHELGEPARAAPTVADGLIFVPTMGNRLLTLARDDGRFLWRYQASPAETPVLGLPAPAYADGLVVAGFNSGELACLHAASGALVWGDSLAAPGGRDSVVDLSAVHGMPVVADGRVYAGSLGGLVLALDLRSGRRLWERTVITANTPAVAGEWLFVLDTEQQLAAIRRTDGVVAWVAQLPRFENEKDQSGPIFWVGPLLAGDRLVVGSNRGRALAVSPYTGAVLGEQSVPGAVAVAPSLAAGTLFLVTDDAYLVALR
jgi:outer membrane protein assembly factor BamB